MHSLLKRADALLVMVDLSHDPIAQMEASVAELRKMRIGIGIRSEEGIIYQKKALIVGNKLDLDNARQNYTTLQSKYGGQLPVIAISAKEGFGLEEMKREIFQMLNIIRVYTKVPGQKPEFADPIILERGSTLEDAAAEVHKDFKAKLKYARLWGSGKHDGVMAKRNHILQDGDIIELHL
jgi:ribosome-interacting GTPase 1